MHRVRRDRPSHPQYLLYHRKRHKLLLGNSIFRAGKMRRSVVYLRSLFRLEIPYSSLRSDTNLLRNLCCIIQKEVAESSGYDIVWLKELAAELASENSRLLT